MKNLFEHYFTPHHQLDNYYLLPKTVRALHSASHDSQYTGTVTIDHGQHLICKTLLNLLKMPRQCLNAPATVSFHSQNHSRDYKRTYNGHTFHSTFIFNLDTNQLQEKFGPFILTLNAVIEDNKLRLSLSNMHLWKYIPVPKLFHPIITALESASNEDYIFDVDIQLPHFGRLIRYRGIIRKIPDKNPHQKLAGV